MGCTIAPEEGMSWVNDLLGSAKATGTVDLGFALSMTDAAAAEIAPVVAAAHPTALCTPSWPRPKAPLTAAGFSALCAASAPTLTSIDVTEAAVPNVMPEAIAHALLGLPRVTDMGLHGATLPRQVLTQIARGSAAATDAVSPASTGSLFVRRLTLGGAGVDHVALAAASRAFPLLEELTVTELPSGADVEAILAVLHRTRATFPLLRRFDAGPAPLSAAARDSLRRLCPMLVAEPTQPTLTSSAHTNPLAGPTQLFGSLREPSTAPAGAALTLSGTTAATHLPRRHCSLKDGSGHADTFDHLVLPPSALMAAQHAECSPADPISLRTALFAKLAFAQEHKSPRQGVATIPPCFSKDVVHADLSAAVDGAPEGLMELPCGVAEYALPAEDVPAHVFDWVNEQHALMQGGAARTPECPLLA